MIRNVSFEHGVASGDPLPDGVVLWTRVSGGGGAIVPVRWWAADARSPAEPVAEGTVEARPDRDHTVHVDVRGLEAGKSYAYGFSAQDVASPIGCTRTAPVGPVDRFRLGVVSCASWVCGYFNAYRGLAERDLDLVLHLGDYIYDDDSSRRPRVREHRPAGRCVTLRDYRARHAQYRTDPDLQRLHQRHPVVAIWDDHDIVNNAWRGGASGHVPRRDGDWGARRAAAVQAYREWLPVRPSVPDDPLRIYRRLALGDLADLVMLDTRLVGRDEPEANGKRAVMAVGGPPRSLLGEGQRAWLLDCLRSSSARWRLIGNQVMMAPLSALRVPAVLRRWGTDSLGLNPSQWDGYPDERRQLLQFIEREGVRNVVVLTGDIHSSWAAELRSDGTTVAAEFVTPSVTSDSFVVRAVPSLPGAARVVPRLISKSNPHLKFFELAGHGYVVVDVTPAGVQADWWHVATTSERSGLEHYVASWSVADGDPRPFEVTTPV